ncbi:DUF6538 domain-containing protein [Bradyrhizobium stylosanthis]|uniref:DUF6538 domain-containing protein n=1 Tax=Bradyrhizobium stylosanthis TaxID=1803665 RepID=UPI000AB3BDF8
MIQPWENPRSKFYWFRRRVPKQFRHFGMPAEIKFSLETTDWEEAVLRCQDENLRLEREWRSNLSARPPPSFPISRSPLSRASSTRKRWLPAATSLVLRPRLNGR